MSLDNDFYDYARMGEQNRQRLGYKGPKVNQPQVGFYGEAGYIPADITTGLIDPVVVYPDYRTGLDLPGRSGGPAADFDNSLSIAGTRFPYGVSAPMVAVVTAPDHTIGSPFETLIDFNNLRNQDQGQIGTVTVELVIPPSNTSLIENLTNLQPPDAVFEYWDGAAYVIVVATRRWDLASVYSYDITLPVGGIETLATLPVWMAADEFRVVYVQDE